MRRRDVLEALVQERTQSLRESEHKYRIIADHTADSIWVMTPDLRFVYQSPSTEHLFGYTANVIAHHGVLDADIYFIQKPFSRNELASKIYKALNEA